MLSHGSHLEGLYRQEVGLSARPPRFRFSSIQTRSGHPSRAPCRGAARGRCRRGASPWPIGDSSLQGRNFHRASCLPSRLATLSPLWYRNVAWKGQILSPNRGPLGMHKWTFSSFQSDLIQACRPTKRKRVSNTMNVMVSRDTKLSQERRIA